MNQNEERSYKSNRQVMFSIIGIAILVIGLVGVTYAFFNYTRTGAANTIRTGRIAFAAEQGEEVTLSDLFPISVNGNVTPETPGVGSVVVHVTGDTEYSKGIEYIVKAVNVSSNGGSSLPISVNISYSANGTGKTIGTEDNNYYANRGGSTSLYKVLTTDTIAEGQELVVGYIAPGETGIDGNITVMAYLDANNIAITDTNPMKTYYELNDNLTAEEEASCEGHTVMSTGFTGSETASAFCAGTGTRGGKTFQEHLDEDLFTAGQIEDFLEANVIKELYTDGTSNDWVDGRTVLTTEEWNALSSGGVSFQIKVEANEGIWVPGVIEGNATIVPTSEVSALVNVTQGNIRYSVPISIDTDMESGDPIVVASTPIFEKYNSTSSSYDDITSSVISSGEYSAVNITFQNTQCHSGLQIKISNHASGFNDGFSHLSTEYVRCLITNSQ